MSLSDWAKTEVEIACKRENPNHVPGEFDYGCACYESALKAYQCLMDDGHSGMSFSFTAGILKRLLEEKPLTPIEDVPEVWCDGRRYGENEYTTYQCKRMSSLFKEVYPDGTVKYHDVDRACGKDMATGGAYSGWLVSKIIDEMYPITMPYYPPLGYYVVETENFLANEKNGDYDTVAVLRLKRPSGMVELVNRYFAEDGRSWREISEADFSSRWARARKNGEG